MVDLTTKVQSKTKSRVDFNIKDFRRLLDQKGLRVEWTRRASCPCSISTSEYSLDLTDVNDTFGQVNYHPECTQCNGKGMATISTQEIKAIVTGITGDFVTTDMGTVSLPQIKLTLLPEHLPSYADKFTLLDSAMIRNEILNYDVGQAVGPVYKIPLTYPAVERTLELANGNESHAITSVFITDNDGVTQPALADNLYLYHSNTNSMQLQGSTPGNDTIAIGKNVSVTYYAKPTFSVFGHPYSIRDTFVRTNSNEVHSSLVVQVIAQLEKK
jgi:hypothetical protein